MAIKLDFDLLDERKYKRFLKKLSDAGYVIVPKKFIEGRIKFLDSLDEILEEFKEEFKDDK